MYFLLCFYMGKFNKNSLELAKGERLTHEPKT